MQRPGADHDNMQLSDFLCDFCRREWDGQFPMVEGHQGSLICGDCLTIAYTETVLRNLNSAPANTKCTMCLEERPDNMWLGPFEGDPDEPLAQARGADSDSDHEPEAQARGPAAPPAACERCIKQAAGRLHKDKDWDWKKPVG